MSERAAPVSVPLPAYAAPPSEARTNSRHHNAAIARKLVAVSLLGDVCAILCGMLGAFWLRFVSGFIPAHAGSVTVAFSDYGALFVIGCMLLIGTFGYLQLYRVELLHRFGLTVKTLTKGLFFWLFLYLAASLVLKFQPPISRVYAVVSFLACGTTVVMWRALFFRFLMDTPTRAVLQNRLVVVGWSDEIERILQRIQDDPHSPFVITGAVRSFSDFEVQDGKSPGVDSPGLKELEQQILSGGVDIVLLGNATVSNSVVTDIANLCEKHYIQFKKVPSHFQILVSGLALENFCGVPVLGVTSLALDRLLNRTIKRIVDVLGAVVGLLVSAPLMCVVAWRLYRESPGPIFYSQVRVGRQGTGFKLHKMRTMEVGADKRDYLHRSRAHQDAADLGVGTTPDDPRLLRIGRIMRKWNIDEVPQFWNVLRGEMSLVGPRPERPENTSKLSNLIPHYSSRHSIKPGMTGWAQVNGFRGTTSLHDRVRCDLYYLENWSLILDIQIMAMTLFIRDTTFTDSGPTAPEQLTPKSAAGFTVGEKPVRAVELCLK